MFSSRVQCCCAAMECSGNRNFPQVEWSTVCRISGNISSAGVARACEGKTLLLSCGFGATVDIVSANYGRLGAAYCDHIAGTETNCRSSNSLDVVKTHCQGRSSCSVPATNSVFGDPCFGAHKYLEVNFSCKPRGKCTKLWRYATTRVLISPMQYNIKGHVK